MDNSTHNVDELLLRYLDNELGPEEREDLEKKLQSDPSYRQQLEDLQISRESIRQYGLRKQVSAIHGQMMAELTTPKRNETIATSRKILRYSMAVAAGLLLLVGGFMAYNFFSLSPDKIYSSRYHAYSLPTSRSNSDSVTDLEKAFREKKYSEVEKLFKSQPAKTAASAFLAGISNLELKDITEAIENFKMVDSLNKASGRNEYQDESEYYLALAYIKNRDYDLSLSILEKIQADPNHLYHRNISARLVKKVKMLKWK